MLKNLLFQNYQYMLIENANLLTKCTQKLSIC
jgi:hypothetical protein